MSEAQMDNVQDRVKVVLVDKLGISETAVTHDAHLSKDLGIDSLDYAELIMEFEHEFRIVIPHQDTERLATVGDLESYIRNKLRTKTG